MKPSSAYIAAMIATLTCPLQSSVAPPRSSTRRAREQRTAADIAERKAAQSKKLARRAAREQGKRS